MHLVILSVWTISLLCFDIEKAHGFMYNDKYSTISTTHGDIMGTRKLVLGTVVYSFLGIPYAKPPIGSLRFRNATTVEKWQGIYSATKLPNTCYQNSPEDFEKNNPAFRVWINNTEMSEDCLYLNIWTPRLPSQINQKYYHKETITPTLVWIHGNGFTSGSSTLDVYNGEILASKRNVIVASMQYRLGPLGFLYLNHHEAPGNQGLTDQILALQWINDNIHNFGGNRKAITLFGSDSGAVSASLHLVSPLTKNLFNQAIMQSTSALNWWSHETPSQATINALNLAQVSGCHGTTPSAPVVIDCMRSLHPSTLIINQWKIGVAYPHSGLTRQQYLKKIFHRKMHHLINTIGEYFFDFPFKPVIGTEYMPQPPGYFITKNIHKLPSRRIMLGFNKNEALIHLIKGNRDIFLPNHSSALPANTPSYFNYNNHQAIDPFDFMAFNLLAEPYLQPFLRQSVAFEYQIPTKLFFLRNWYSNEVVEKFNELVADYNYKCPIIDFADLYYRKSSTYLYSFEHRTKNLPLPPWTGVMTGDEIPYIFGKPFDQEFQNTYYKFTDKERELSDLMMKYWTNFAQTGFPNMRLKEFNKREIKIYWEYYTAGVGSSNNRSHIVFDNSSVSMSRNLRRHRCLFWRHLVPHLQNQILDKNRCPDRTKYMEDKVKPLPPSEEPYNKPIVPSQQSNSQDTSSSKSELPNLNIDNTGLNPSKMGAKVGANTDIQNKKAGKFTNINPAIDFLVLWLCYFTILIFIPSCT